MQNRQELNISFAPNADYGGIAKAASGGKAWAAKVSTIPELNEKLSEAVREVIEGERTPVLHVRLAKVLMS